MDGKLNNQLLGYQKVADYTVSGSAITSYDFTGLNITKEDDYMLVANLVNTTGTDARTYIYANANYTLSNYYSQLLQANGTSLLADRQNNPYFVANYASGKTLTISKLKLTNNGYFTFQAKSNFMYGGSSIHVNDWYGSSTFTATSITSLRIGSNVANALGIGSRFQLYKRVAPIIADITVSTATTSVDITGLSMDKGSEYMLVSNLVNSVGSNSSYYIYTNGNTTTTNYYTQEIYATSSTVAGNRFNNPAMLDSSNGETNLIYSNIKLTNNSYYVVQNNSSRYIPSSSVNLVGRNLTSTFTATSITSLRIKASVSNGIGIGSRFQLIKLK